MKTEHELERKVFLIIFFYLGKPLQVHSLLQFIPFEMHQRQTIVGDEIEVQM